MINYPRWQISTVKEALKTRRVVIISGARQTGKTTLSKLALNKFSVFKPLDIVKNLESALNDPSEFVQNETGTMIIDEIQKVPSLISEIKYIVDNDNRPGQFLLTGSANINSLPEVTESMAGRVTNIQLRPLTQGEIAFKKPIFLERAFNKHFPKQISGYNKEDIFNLAFRGGFPEVVRLKAVKERKNWFKDYISALVKKDLRDISNVTRQQTLKNLIKILASWSGRFMDISAIGAFLEISRPTLTSYINLLETLFLFEKVEPYLNTDYDRVGRTSKTYATDTGLMASVLGWKINDVLTNNDRAGKLMETFVFHELSAQIDLDNDFTLYQYRDREKREIDFIIERDDGAIVGIEVKSALSVSKSDFSPQIWFKENIYKNKTPYIGIVLYAGDQTLSFGNNLLAVPIAALWEN